jgi:ABC-2 type transport system permease protein
MSHFWSAARAATIYEFRMQLRRPALWVTLVLLMALLVTGTAATGWEDPAVPGIQVLASAAVTLSLLLTMGAGCLIANRLPRDRSTGMSRLLEALPAGPGALLTGKWLGATLATAVPMLLLYLGVAVLAAVQRGEPGMLLAAVPAFVVVLLPGLLFVGAFSIACPVVLWVPLYQFLFVCYWLWGNAMNPELLPTLSNTWLTPAGSTIASGLFDAPALYVRGAAVWEAFASIALLLAMAVLALAAGTALLRRQADAR